jgi:MATE family multidrug resistance protein
LINILTGLLGVFFVFYFNLAITGIAIADVIAQYIGMAYALFFIFLYFKRQEVTFKSFSLVNQLSYLFSLNTDILIRTIALVGALFLFSVFSSYMGPVVLVVNTIIM